jgi:guanylate kinase
VRRGTLIVLAGPSGVGKGSVVRRLRSRDPEGLVYSVSVTSRAPRRDERDGVDYHFISDGAFDRMIADDALLEWAEVVGHRSGTPAAFVEETRDAGRDVLLELDVKGAQRVRAREPHAVLVFLVPPSFAELEERLRGRETEDEAAIQRRLETARWELQQEGSFDHVVVNDDLDRAADEVAAIIEASRTPDLL